MKKNNLFLEILCWVGLVLWSVAFFFGFNYVEKGALMVSISVSVCLLLVMGVLVIAMKKFSRGTNGHAMQSRNAHYLSLGLYALVSLGTAIFICHFVKVSLEDQAVIQNEAIAQIEELEATFSKDQVKNSYLAWVADRSDSYRIHLESKNVEDGTIKVKLADLESQLVDGTGFSSLQQEVLDFVGSCRYAVSNWVWLTIPNYLSRLEVNKPDYESRAVACSKKSELISEEEAFCPVSIHNNVGLMTSLEKLSWSDISLWSVLLVIVLQLFVLLSYWVGKPNTGKDPKKYKNAWGRSYRGDDDSPRQRKQTTSAPASSDDIDDVVG